IEGKETSPSDDSEKSSILDLPSLCDLAEDFELPHSSEDSEELFHSVDTFPYPPTGLWEHTEPSDPVLLWMYEDDDSPEDTSIRKSLDDFYKMYCKKRPDRTDPTYEAASQCLSQRVSELANQDGTKYASRCLQMAQVVLNRDGCKIFPNNPPAACFSKTAEGEVVLEDRKITPGLSDDVLEFLLKQTRTK
ncbi:Uncharacterized protein C20orf196, partial [Mesitornis unicolor]